MVEVTPSILAITKKEFDRSLSKVSGLVDRVEVDVIDGVFANNKTVGLSEVDRGDFSGKVDVHLMVDKPLGFVDKAVKFGTDCLIAHIEKMESQLKFVRQVKEKGMRVGLAIDLPTAVEEIDESLWSELDAVLLMSVPAGFSGQVFQEEAFLKIKRVKKIKDSLGLSFDIIVDGGVNLTNVKEVVCSGANVLAVTSVIWKAKDVSEVLNLLKLEAEKGM
jgi:ribulose-phosphate 3-epimerase